MIGAVELAVDVGTADAAGVVGAVMGAVDADDTDATDDAVDADREIPVPLVVVAA